MPSAPRNPTPDNTGKTGAITPLGPASGRSLNVVTVGCGTTGGKVAGGLVVVGPRVVVDLAVVRVVDSGAVAGGAVVTGGRVVPVVAVDSHGPGMHT